MLLGEFWPSADAGGTVFSRVSMAGIIPFDDRDGSIWHDGKQIGRAHV